MVQNVGRKVVLILVLLVAATFSILLAGFRLGLDLKGGTRLVYSLPLEGALEEGLITQQEYNNPRELINQMIGIINERIDPQGVRDPVIRAEGDDRIVIEIPGAASELRRDVSGTLLEDVQPGTSTINLATDDEELLSSFPGSGGVVEIGDEKVRYRTRHQGTLAGATRGVLGTERSFHAAGAEVHLINSDPWQELIENVGDLGFYIRASAGDFGQETDLTSEQEKVERYVEENEVQDSEGLAAFNRLPFEEGGPWPRLRWFPFSLEQQPDAPFGQRIQPLIIEENEQWRFTGEDLQAVFPSQDDLGYPAVGFEMSNETKNAFGDFTDEHVGEPMAIVINGEIATMPTIEGSLPGRGIITGGPGGFTFEEVQELVTILRSGSLKIKPELEHRERVGATLGDDYVKRGALSCLVGLLVVLVFVVVYYRRLGIFAAISLVCNLLLLMGALSFLQAALTLPGVAGIVLTVGMAVDANVLIYERIREEILRGRKPAQAAKDGFANALSAIVDGNLTTLITGLILYKFGTGPVRGFATTLSLGILTSMFSALVITRVLVHLQLQRGIGTFKMMRAVKETHFKFVDKARYCIPASLILILAGLGLFISIPDREKLGIDFLGGVTMTVRTEEPQPVNAIRERVRSIEGLIGDSAEVKSILASGSQEEGYTQFRITAKAHGEGTEGPGTSDALKDTVENEVTDALADILGKGPFEISVQGGRAQGTLYFQDTHDVEDVRAGLVAAGVDDPSVERVAGHTPAYSFSGAIDPGVDTASFAHSLEGQFADVSPVGNPDEIFRWANPVPEVSVVGAQVVSELRDDAIVAILLSLFAVVMYIRVRFAEYSYGFAAIAAIVHDVLITLGALAIAIRFDFIEGEINLPMIAAFLTIIGYSLNDTIVIFDRVRENLPRTRASLKEVIDLSVNQTLARTVLMACTTLATLLVLLGFNLGSRNVLESFAFALAVGVVAGTYSTIWIATPVLLWLESRRLRKQEATGGQAAARGERPTPVKAG